MKNVLNIMGMVALVLALAYACTQYDASNDPTMHAHTAACAQGDCPFAE